MWNLHKKAKKYIDKIFDEKAEKKTKNKPFQYPCKCFAIK